MNKALLSSSRHNWMTPCDLFDQINSHMNFELDPCAESDNLGLHFYTKKDNGLQQSWKEMVCFVNPPYGKEQRKWVEKALLEKKSTSVFLIPARVDTKLWQEIIFKKASRICFLKGRVSFIDPKTKKKTSPSPFPSALVLFNAGYFEKRNFEKACKKMGTII
jgi:phage N-6-adenine-methyltransferase